MSQPATKKKPKAVTKIEPRPEIPKLIKVLGQTIKVQRAKLQEDEFGEYIQHKKIIKISIDSKYEEARLTLFHEACHAALHLSGLSEMLPSTQNGPDLEEAIIICLENAFGHIVDIDKLK